MIEENKKKKKSLLRKILKRIKVSHIIILAVLLSANTYAWFIYITTVSNNLDVHIKSWQIDFTSGDTPITDYVHVYVDNVYPGMTTYVKPITANNYSEVPATASFKVLEATIMGEQFMTIEGRADAGEQPVATDLTSAQLVNKLANDYPFHITFTLSNAQMVPEVGEATYTVSISWPYESGDDETDTYWGNEAYDYRENNPTLPCISLVVKIYITQTPDPQTPDPQAGD